jgi:hypothetical protein
MTLSTPGVARAQPAGPGCNLHTLRGLYVFDAHGFNIVGGVAVPKAILEGINFNGDGTLAAPFVTLSINGNIIHSSGTLGTYTVQGDCTGTVTFADGNSFDIFVQRDDGKQLWMIQTVAVFGATAVFEGMATRVP